MNSYMGKRLLILGGASQCISLVKKAKELGLYTIVADLNANAPAKKYADYSVDISLLDAEAVYQWCVSNGVDGIINTNVDAAQKTQQYVCERLNMPHYSSMDNVRILTNKRCFKDVCRENGLDVIDDYTVEQLQKDDSLFPVFVKPEECSGSRGVAVCNNFEELSAGLDNAKKLSRNGEAIIEDYLDKSNEFMATYVVIDGEPYLERTTDRYTGLKADKLDKVSVLAVSPSMHTQLFVDKINDKIVRLIKKMGIENGPVFMQGFYDDNTIKFFDPALRLPGANFESILKQATDIDVLKILIDFSLGFKNDTSTINGLKEAYLLNGKTAAICFPVLKTGTIDSIEGTETISSMKGVLNFSLRHFRGDQIKEVYDISRRVCEVDLLCDSDSELKKVLAEIYKTLYVAGSDNAMFSRKLLLVGDNKTYIGVLPDVFRPDLEINLCMDENALMCGFSAVIDMSKLEPDTYRVCVMAQSGCSRMKLFKETNKYIKVK